MEKIHHNIYKSKVPRCCIPFSCCLKKLRRKLVSKTLVKISPEDMHYSFGSLLMKVFNQVLHGFDLYTDLSFAFYAKLKSEK